MIQSSAAIPRKRSQVIVIGAGPIGVTAALFLTKAGIDVTVLERFPSMLEAPKAHMVSPRSLEILSAVGVLTSSIESIAPDRALGTRAWFGTSLAGHYFGSLAYEPGTERGEFAHRINVPQPALERRLRERLEETAPGALHTGHKWLHLVQSDSGVLSTVEGPDGCYEIESDYVIAADGAGSQVRESLGIRMQGPPPPQARTTIHFEADLTDLVGDRAGALYFIGNETTEGTFLAYDPSSTWAFIGPPLPEDDPDFTPESVIRTSIGAEAAFEIKSVMPWVVSAEVARQYQHGRVFLTGDAAHRFPPSGGLGLNSGMGDAENLAWKLAAVLRGDAVPALLETYDAERRPVAENNRDQSLVNLRDLTEIFPAMREYAVSGDDSRAVALLDRQEPAVNTVGLQLGYRYGSAWVPAVVKHEPTAEVGDYVPHAALLHYGQEVAPRSLIGEGRFLLMVTPEHLAKWQRMLETAHPCLDIVGVEPASADAMWWAEVTGVRGQGGLLLRPDAHILASFSEPTDGIAEQIAEEIRTLLGYVTQGAESR